MVCCYLPVTVTVCCYLPVTATVCCYLPVTVTVCCYLPVTVTVCCYLPVTVTIVTVTIVTVTIVTFTIAVSNRCLKGVEDFVPLSLTVIKPDLLLFAWVFGIQIWSVGMFFSSVCDGVASEDQIQAAKEVVKKLRFQFSSEAFENPFLQRHWRNIEALALDRDEPDEFIDYTSMAVNPCLLISVLIGCRWSDVSLVDYLNGVVLWMLFGL